MRWTSILGTLAIGLAVGTSVGFGDDDARAQIDTVLDDFHAAASRADGERYFGHLTDDAVFLGTDASERWPKAAFEAFAKPYFDQGKGWTYVPQERHVDIEPGGTLAWFDELLANESYGTCRGSGVLRREDGRWRIAQYNLTFTVPNEVAKDVVDRIRAHDAGVPVEPDRATVVYVVVPAESVPTQEVEPLSDAGRARALRLARMLRSAEIDAVYSTELAHARATAAPLAEELGLETRHYARGALRDLVSRVREGVAGRRVFVVIHRDDIAEFLTGLGVSGGIGADQAEHDRVFVLALPGSGGTTLAKLHMGD